MSVDLSKAMRGSRVYFRCGGEAVISAENTTCNEKVLYFAGDELRSYFYYMDGNCCSGLRSLRAESLFDIIRIDPPEFDWSTVKPGMAFFCTVDGSIKLFVGHSWVSDDGHKSMFHHSIGGYFHKRRDFGGHPAWIAYCHMSRAPDHDIEVKP